MFAGGAGAQPSASNDQDFRAVYQQIVEINSFYSGGGTSKVAAGRERLLAAGFRPDEVTLMEPFPGKGNRVARFKGSGHKPGGRFGAARVSRVSQAMWLPSRKLPSSSPR